MEGWQATLGAGETCLSDCQCTSRVCTDDGSGGGTGTELERVCDVKARALRRALRSLELAGGPLSRSEEGASRVVWRVEKGWAPGMAHHHLLDPAVVAPIAKPESTNA